MLHQAPVQHTVQQRWNADHDTGRTRCAQTRDPARSTSVHFGTARRM